ncbi:hypothetical protein, partial [Streptomyces sp. NPDC047071]|uniref:hypothetical protein n=1 Tax=Streptomyces sp. NPDC047071 TaxID=3154808 RepID=UPI003451AD55
AALRLTAAVDEAYEGEHARVRERLQTGAVLAGDALKRWAAEDAQRSALLCRPSGPAPGNSVARQPNRSAIRFSNSLRELLRLATKPVSGSLVWVSTRTPV